MLHLNCTALSQSESSNFFMCIIILVIPFVSTKQNVSAELFIKCPLVFLVSSLHNNCSKSLATLRKRPLIQHLHQLNLAATDFLSKQRQTEVKNFSCSYHYKGKRQSDLHFKNVLVSCKSTFLQSLKED